MRPILRDVHEYEQGYRPAIIVVAVPSFGTVSIRWHVGMLGLKPPMNVPLSHSVVMGREVGVARNELVARALALRDERHRLRASHLFFVDDDVLLSESALQQLSRHRAPIVSGVYWSKSTPPYPLILPDKLGGTATGWTVGDLIPCYAHGMGCTLITLDVFREMHRQGTVEVDEAPCTQCAGRGCDGCCATGRTIRWFETVRDRPGERNTDGGPTFSSQTEDVTFCERAAAAGYQPLVDTAVRAFHFDRVSGEAYPLDQWREYRSTGRVSSWPDETQAVEEVAAR